MITVTAIILQGWDFCSSTALRRNICVFPTYARIALSKCPYHSRLPCAFAYSAALVAELASASLCLFISCCTAFAFYCWRHRCTGSANFIATKTLDHPGEVGEGSRNKQIWYCHCYHDLSIHLFWNRALYFRVPIAVSIQRDERQDFQY